MFGRKTREREFERDVRIEIELLQKVHGDDAARAAREKAARPTNRTARQKVLDETVRRLEGGAEAPRQPLMARLFAGSAK